MATGVTRVSDIIVPEIFKTATVKRTEEKSNLIKSGAIMVDPVLAMRLAGPGLLFDENYLADLDQDNDNVSTDNPSDRAETSKLSEIQEQQVRLSRNHGWSVMDLANKLSANDPLGSLVDLVGNYWSLRLQAAFIATMRGVFADNAKAPGGTEHVINDMTHDIKGSNFSRGVTSISAAAIIDTKGTMGDSSADLSLMMVHSIPYATMLKNNLIDFIPESINGNAVEIPFYNGMRVVVNDNMVSPERGVFETWLFGKGAIRVGMQSSVNDGRVVRDEAAGNGGGQETLWSRKEFIVHPVGYRYAGTAARGGPSNENTTNNLAHEDSFMRVAKERKQVKIARLITREY